MEWIDELHLEYPEHDRTGGFSFASVLLDEDDLSKVMQDKNVVECGERTSGKYEGVFNVKNRIGGHISIMNIIQKRLFVVGSFF